MSLAIHSYLPLLLLIGLVPFIILLGRPRMARFPAWLRRAAIATRVSIVVLVVLSLTRPMLGTESDARSVIFAVDRSDSVSRASQEAADSYVAGAIRSLAARQNAGVVSFGRSTAIERPLEGVGAPGQVVQVPSDGTDLGEAIRLARSMFPRTGAKRIVLLSDGRENLGAVEPEIRAAIQAGVQIAIAPQTNPAPEEVLVEAVEVAPQIREGDALDIVVAVGATVSTRANVRLWLDGRLISDQAVDLSPGSNRFTASQANLKKGFHTLWARVEAERDTFGQNNELSAYTVVKDRPRVLIVAPTELEVRPLRDALVASEIQVEVRQTQAITPKLSAMRRYDGLIIANTAATAFSLDQQRTVRAFVQTLGGGLVVIGGENSYGLGDYARTPIADALPVNMNIPGKRDRGSVAMVLIIDKSGSMDMREDGTTKMHMAREAASLALESLDPADRIGVLVFDTQPRWSVAPRQLGTGPDLELVRERIRAIDASGGTEIFPALDVGFRAIRDLPSRYKHIILLSDGRSLSNADYDRLISQMRQASITLSSIAIGSDADVALLSDLARQGEGRYYFVDKARDIPVVTTKEARIASGSPVVEGQVSPKVLSPSPVLKAIAPPSIPALSGYLVTTIKDQAQTVLAPNDVRADPILAQWQYGLGRSVAWTSDLGKKWAGSWQDWPDYRRFWSQVVRWTLPAPVDPNIQVSTSHDGTNALVRVDAVDDDGGFRDGQDIRLNLQGADLRITEQRLRQVGPGRYETQVRLLQPGVYSVEAVLYEADRPSRVETYGLTVPYPAEYRAFGNDDIALNRIAAMTGGRVLRDPRASFIPDGLKYQGFDWHPLWPYLLGLALLLFPLDIAMRRLQVPADQVARWIRGLGRLIPRPADAGGAG